MTRKHRPSGPTTLHIRNMVCNRCIKVVRDELQRLSYEPLSVSLGEAAIPGDLSVSDRERIRKVLEANGFELIEDRRARTIEKIKHAILQFVQTNHEKNPVTIPASGFIARAVGQEYTQLSTLFSSMEGMTVEHYLILQKIERVKELLKYGELTLSEISYQLGYSSLQHLSNQFKTVTGMTPSQFRKMVGATRKPLDKVK